MNQTSSKKFCDGVSRRNFLRIGSLAPFGVTLPSIFQAEAASNIKGNQRSVIMIYLSGGMAHQDSFDLKPNAPTEVRGEFKPIPTNVSGIEISEHLPKLAACADKYIVLRSLVGQIDEHSSFQSTTGYPMSVTKRDNKPHFGSVISKVQGQVNPSVPAFVDLFPTMQHKPYNSSSSGFLGRASAGVRLDGEGIDNMKLQGLTSSRFEDRKILLDQVDAFRRNADRLEVSGMNQNYQRAFEVLTSSKLVEAIDVTKEPSKVRERYGKGSSKHLGDGGPLWNDQLLMARRLVEAGSRCVTVAYGFWDTHGNNFKHMKEHLPTFDQGVSALIEDIYARGMDKTTTVCVWGEFGRTPKINKDAGRDHWSRVNFALLAGGGMKTGQVIGSTDSSAGSAKDYPINYLDVLATIYSNMGIDPHAMVVDISGRPNPILPSTVSPISRVYS
jgi:hypothetical protein